MQVFENEIVCGSAIGMFISQVADGQGSSGEEGHSHEYQTANELFDLMAKNHNFQPNGDETLTTRDLVILYKNIDLGTQLMTNANEFKKKTPNQYVETVVYNDDPDSDSDVSEIYSSENLHNVVLINKERIDLLNHPPSLENTLCPKFGDLEIQSSDLAAEYDRQFLFKDPYIEEQLKSLSLMSNTNEFAGTILPASLLDYICCKRLEDNYNFYMDNIIRYVKNTIEQLKRISNGDYLTEKAKEKWREVNKSVNDDTEDYNTKILETSASIPLHVERKITGHATTWDDIVHSEVDIRYLSKILEKKIVIEVPKLICGSYRLFSKCYEDNLIISCKREAHPGIAEAKEEESRVDVVFKLQRSESGHVMSNISSIMILQKTPSAHQATTTDLLSIEYEKNDDNVTKVEENTLKSNVIEQMSVEFEIQNKVNHIEIQNNIINIDSNTENEKKTDSTVILSSDELCYNSDKTNDYYTITNISGSQNSEGDSLRKPILILSSDSSSTGLRDIFNKKRNNRTEASFNAVPPDELRLTMQSLNIQSSLPEESTEDTSVNVNTKIRSPQRNRVKSPYENKSHLLEEKKRKKLLEIRERREKKKIAMSEQCKVTKAKYGKGAIMPQTSSSVTKLSITNKSFYNSIYGQTININLEPKQSKIKGRKENKKDSKISSDASEIEDDITVSASHSKKYINRSYYLDDTVTEMMYLQMKKKADNKESYSESASAVSNDFNANLTMLSQLISPCSITDLNCKDSLTPMQKLEKLDKMVRSVEENGCHSKNLVSSQSTELIMVPVNSPKDYRSELEKQYPKKSSASNTSVQCRKSIDKIYELMKTLGKSDGIESKLIKSKFTGTANADKISIIGGRKSSTIQGSDSGTSVKHHLTSSNPSYFSFDKTNLGTNQTKKLNTKKAELPVVPKVIISTKSQTPKTNGEKVTNKRKTSPNPNVDNPLHAISQLLHEFDNVQKTRHKVVEFKPMKKVEIATDKIGKRPRRCVPISKDHEAHTDKYAKINEKKHKLGQTENTKIHMESKQFTKTAKLHVADIIDEYKEARGEAVRGPKLNSRLNSLAQPKKTYVQAHIVDCHTKYGKNMVSDRLQRLAAAPLAQIPEKPRIGFSNIKAKQKRSGAEAGLIASVKHPLSALGPLEKFPKHKHQIGTVPDVMKMASSANEPRSYKQCNVVDKPISILKKKMVAVESYVKSHYGRILQAPTEPNDLLTEGLTSRVPLIPRDIELSSLTSSPPLEESSAIGKRLHNIVDTIINSSPTLSADAQFNESNSKYSKDNIGTISLAINVSKEALSTHYDGVFVDQSLKKKNLEESMQDEKTANGVKNLNIESTLQPFSSVNELEILENALHRRLSVGTFQKRLRLKNLTLTPKQSMQQVMVLQSGDVGSLVVKSTISQNFNLENSKSDTKVMTKLSNTKLNWNFSQIPMQIATVGYAFPVIHSAPKCVANDILNIRTLTESKTVGSTSETVSESLKSERSRCFRDTAAKVDRKDVVTITKVIEINPVVTVNNAIITELTNKLIATNDEPLKQSVPQKDKCDEKKRITQLKVIVNDKNQPDDKNNREPSNRIDPEKANSDGSKKVFGPFNPVITIPVIDQHDSNIIIPSKEIKVNDVEDEKKVECVDYSSSLDVLAGLLSEIQKITTCQTQITNNETDFHNDHLNKQFIMSLLKDSADIEKTVQSEPHDIISITSLDKLRQLESNHSIYSYYISNDGDKAPNKCHVTISEVVDVNSKYISCDTPINADKEVNVDLPEREFTHKCTDKQSRFFPITVNNATNVSNSLIGVLSEPSTLSMFPFTDTDLINPDSSLVARKKIIELPQKENEPMILHQKEESVIEINDTKELPKNIEDMKQMQSKIKNDITVVETRKRAVTLKHISKNNESLHLTLPSVPKITDNFINNNVVATDTNFTKSYDEPTMKMKRDVLVTVYSILVFTVFAALSLPDMIYHT